MASPAPSNGSVKSESEAIDGPLIDLDSDDVVSIPSEDEDEASAARPAAPPDLGASVFGRPKPVIATDPRIALRIKQFRVDQLLQQAKNLPDPASSQPAEGTEDAESAVSTALTGPALHFAKLKKSYERKERAGTTTLQERIDFMRAQDAEALRINASRIEGTRSPSPFFVPDTADETPNFPEDDGEDFPEQGRKRRGPAKQSSAPKKQRKSRARQRGNHEDDEDDEMDIMARASAHIAAKKSKQPTAAKPRSKKAQGPTMLNTSNLLGGSNVFDDAAATKDFDVQPTFGSTKKRNEALAQLIASVPEEAKRTARGDKKYLDRALKAFTGQGSVSPAADGLWLVRGMKTTLKAYQILGVSFLRQRENSSRAPLGGILGDQMGLGKTLMMLANIVNGRSLQTRAQRTTLIVASPALIKQWRNEITKHVLKASKTQKNGIGTVLEYNAIAKNATSDEIELIMQQDVVLTTYSQVSKSCPKADPPAELTTPEQKLQWWTAYLEQHKGALHRVTFHRIILDEAQSIKNHNSLTSIACRALTAKHHWAISGTPILNSIKEFYPYFRFLRVPGIAATYRQFKQNFCTPEDPDGIDRLHFVLRGIMIRRTHLDTLFNAKLLDLPQPSELTMFLEFNEIERNIYEIVKKRFIQRINCISRSGLLEKEYNHIWTMLLRLRQLCSHPALIQGSMIELLEQEDIEKLTHLSTSEVEISEDSTALLTHLREKLKNNIGMKTVESRPGDVIIQETETVPAHIVDTDDHGDTGGKHGLTYHFSRYLDTLVNSEAYEKILDRSQCTGCKNPPKDPHVTSCYHIYCYTCLNSLQDLAARKGREGARCTKCGTQYTEASRCGEALERFSQHYATITGTPDRTSSGKPKRESIESWVCMNGEVLPSTKTLAVKAQVLEWLAEDADAKIIIYSQFIPMLQILSRICITEGWEFCRYTGKMSHESRERAIQDFGDPEQNKRIFLMSLKCGGLGLNLTMASRVITLDPWWNAAVEQQAFCRVFRIGQEKKTKMTRMAVKGTIDEAILALQAHKQVEIDMAMDDAKRKKNLSMQDMLRLFGNVREAEDGQPFIFAEETEGQVRVEVPRPRPRYGSVNEDGDLGDEE